MVCVAILVSGEGKLTRRLLDSAYFNEIEQFKLSGVISSDPQAPVLSRARNLRLPAYVVERRLFPNEATYGQALLHKLRDIDADFVILDGFTPECAPVARHFQGKVLGVRFSPVGRSMEITVYLADAWGGVGELLEQWEEPLKETDTHDGFVRRVYELAENMLLEAVESYCRERG